MVFVQSSAKNYLFLIVFAFFLGLQNIVSQDVVITPTYLDFGNVTPGETKELTLNFAPSGNGNTQLFVDFSDFSDARFQIIGQQLDYIIVPANGVDVTVQFSPNIDDSGTISAVFIPKGAFGSPLTFNPTNIALAGFAGEQTAPQLEVDTLIEIGEKDINTTTTQNIEITNSGTADLIISNAELSFSDSEDANDFSLGSITFPVTVSPSASTTIPVVFNPKGRVKAAGSLERSATLTITSNDNNESNISPHLVTINGDVLAPILALAETTIDYNSVLLGETKTKDFVIQNNGSGTLIFENISLLANASASELSKVDDFKITSTHSFPLAISGGSSVTISTSFTPSERNKLNEVIFRIETLNDEPQTDIPITGKGIVSTLSTIANINFGNTRLGTTSEEMNLDIENTGDVTITISELALSGTNHDAFAIIDNSPTTLNAGEKIAKKVTFTPSSLGDFSATISFTSDATNSPHQINLTGKGFNSKLEVDTSPIVFDAQIINTVSESKNLLLSNKNGTDKVTINTITLVGDDVSSFELQDVPTTINAGEEKSIKVLFTPKTEGDKSANIFINSNDENSPISIAVSGTVIAPKIETSEEISFKNTKVDGTRNLSFIIRNKGETDLTINEISLSDNATHFSIENLSYPFTIASGENKVVKVTFNPKNIGDFSSDINITTKNIGIHKIPMTGKAVFAKLVVNTETDLDNITKNETKEVKLELLNEGTRELKITGISFSGANPELFSLSSGSTKFPFFIAPGGKKTRYIKLSPNSEGTISSIINIQSNTDESFTSPTITANVNSKPQLSVASHIELKDAFINVERKTTFELTNTGTEDLHIKNYVLTSAYNISFTPSVNPPKNLMLPPNTTLTFSISHTPSSNDLETASIKFFTNDDRLPEATGFTTPTYVKEVLVTGGLAKPVFQLESTTPIVFENTGIGRTNSNKITIKNTGSASLIFSDDSETFNTGMFTILNPNNVYGEKINPGETFDIPIQFLPQGNTGLKTGEITLVTNEDAAGTDANIHKIAVQGTATPTTDVVVGGLTFRADSKTQDGDYTVLSGNVSAGNLQFSGDVRVNTTTRNIKGNGKIFLTNIPIIGVFGGDEVQIYNGNFDFTADATTASLALTTGITKLSSALSLVGLPFEITKLDLIEDGVILGGSLNLPEVPFGEDAGIVIETLEIHKVNGVNLVGEASLSPNLKILKTFELNDAKVAFNTIENTFSGGATITLSLLGKDVTIGASVSIIEGDLDAVELVIGVDPGIPLGATGLNLSQGGGFISGLKEGPISFGLSNIEIVPAIPFDTVSLTDMSVSYTLGEKLSAGGSVELYDLNVGSGSLAIFSKKANISIDVNLLNILIGNANLSIEQRKNTLTNLDQLFLEGNTNLKVQIPKIDCTGAICEAVNDYLPLEFASLSAYFNNYQVCVTLTIAEGILEVVAGIDTTSGQTKFKFGGNFAGISFGNAGKIPYNFKKEYNTKTDDENSLEGKSIIIEGGAILSKSQNADITVPFTLNQTYRNIILRVEGANETPNFTVVLPDGTIINQENALEKGVIHSLFNDGKRRYYVLANTQIGEHKFIVENKGDTYEFDVFGAELAPEIAITNVNHNQPANTLTIDWTDIDLDSDAKIAFYLDTDNKNADGTLIAEDISEDDNTDTYTWNTSTLENGTYYVYAKIDDGKNAPKIVYGSQTFEVNNISSIPTTTLASKINNNTIELSWTNIPEASTYRVFVDENTISENSTSYNVGSDTSFDFTTIQPGRTYNFGVKVIDENLNASNLSNIETVTFVSSTINNQPKIDTKSLTAIINGCEAFSQEIQVSDADVNDNLTLNLTEAPTGMTINGNTLSWMPNSFQLGNHLVTLKVDDNNGGTVSKTYEIMVTDTEKPVAKTKDIIVQVDTNGIAVINPNMVDNGSTDNCGISNYILSKTMFNLDNLGENTVTLQVVDFNGNIAKATAKVTVDNTLGVTKNEVDSSIFVYPNPTKKFINISSKINGLQSFSIYSIQGKEVMNQQFSSYKKEHKLNTENLSKGFYFIKIITYKGSKTFKILKN